MISVHTSIGDVISRLFTPPARWARACLTCGVVLVAAVVIVKTHLTPSVDDFGTGNTAATASVSLPGDIQPGDIRVTGGIAGQLDVPTDPADVGWWNRQRRCRVARRSHRDRRPRRLGRIRRGRAVPAHRPDNWRHHSGDCRRWRNSHLSGQRTTHLRQDHRFAPAIFGTDGAPRLVLITCGGAFDKATLSYESNVAVFANPS